MSDQVADRESSESAIPVEVGTKHCPCGPDTGIGKRFLKPRRWQVDDGDRVANQRQRRAHGLECFRVVVDREMAGLPA